MKKCVGRDARHVFIRIDVNRSGVRVLHAPAPGPFAGVQNKRVPFEGSPFHELEFILTDALQVSLNLFLLPVVTVYYNPNLRLKPRQLKLLEFAYLNGSIRKRVVVGGFEKECPRASHRFESSCGSTLRPPVTRRIWNIQLHIFGAPLWNVEKDHCWIDEGMLGIQLRCERTRFIPIRRVGNLDRSRPLDAPRLLVYLFSECLLRTYERLYLLHVTAEVADLVERIPRGHPNNHLARHIGNSHRDLEEMSLRMIQENRILNCCSCRSAERQNKEKTEAGGNQQPASGGSKGHRDFASP